jgi:hypothetical protein
MISKGLVGVALLKLEAMKTILSIGVNAGDDDTKGGDEDQDAEMCTNAKVQPPACLFK